MASQEVCAVFAVVESSSELMALGMVGAEAEPSRASGVVGSMGRRTLQSGSARASSSALQGFVSSWR